MSFILLYGKPGSGKTTLAASMTKLGYKVHFIDVDRKVDKMLNIKSLLDKGLITHQPILSKLTESTLRQKLSNAKIALLKAPKGYLELVDIIDDYESQMSKGEQPPAEVLVLDSLTSGVEHFKRYAMHLNASSPKFDNKMQFDQWNMLLANLEELFVTLQRLIGFFKHVIVICHEMTESEQIGDQTFVKDILPFIEGSMRHKVGKYFEEVYHCEVKKVGQEIKYQVMTTAVDKYTARTSRDLKIYEVADFKVLFKEEANAQAKALP